MVLTAVFILGLGGFVFPDEETQAIFEYIGVWSQMGAFAKGIVDTRYLVYDFSLATLCVFLAVRVVQTERLQ
jgi:ABC-2 type transport system permease protein